MPHNALLEPNFATPAIQNRSFQRWNRVNAVQTRSQPALEEGQLSQHSVQPAADFDCQEEEDDYSWQLKMDNLLEQVNALRVSFNRKWQFQPRRNGWQSQQQQQFRSREERDGSRFQQPYQQEQKIQRNDTAKQQQNPQQLFQPWQAQQQQEQQPDATQQNQNLEVGPPQNQSHQQPAWQGQRRVLVCWNCDEEGHRFPDCPKPQAILFCYRCGRKGYSLRSYPTCCPDSENFQAGNQQ